MFPKVPFMLIGMKPRTRKEVGAIAERRMQELRLTRRKVAQAAGVDYNTVRDLMDGSRKPNEENRGKITAALRWRPGGLDDLYKGGRATPIETDDPIGLASDEELLAEIGKRLRERLAHDTESALPGLESWRRDAGLSEVEHSDDRTDETG